MEATAMNEEKYAIAVKAVRSLKNQVLSDAWRGSFRHECFTDKFVDVAARSHFFIDAGAEFGFYAWLAIRHMPPDRRIYLFEPEPERHQALRDVFQDYGEVTVLPFALAARQGVLTMYKETIHHSCTLDAHLSQSAAGVAGETFTVETVGLDDFFQDAAASIDLIKMDIEGAELFALQGMERILSMGRAELFVEFHPGYVRSCDPDGMALIEGILARNGYAVFSCQGLDCVPGGVEVGRAYVRRADKA
jgi:FkbM family methyltransferase